MSTFQKIRDLLARDLNRPIEEVIKLSQTDEDVVYTELTEYVITDNLRRHYTDLLRAINESITNPTEGIGVWVSGFFGSGKSAFAKNLGYILANPLVKGHHAADLFIERVREAAPGDSTLPDLIRNLTSRVTFEVLMFDVSATRAVQRETERLAEVMYRVLLEQLDYASRRYEIAELEIELEGEGRLAEFVRTVAEMWREQGRSIPPAAHAPLPITLDGELSADDYAIWRTVRSGTQAVNRASAALHRMDPATYPKPDSWAESIRDRSVDVTVHLLIDRTFELAVRRRPGKAVFYIIDEVGQYVARSGDRILDLQGVVREFGAKGRNLAIQGKAPAPVWIVVTSQEKLSEVVDSIGDQRVELAKLQDSFRHHIDLGPQDIQEVAARRVLLKKPEAVPFLHDLYEQHRGTLNSYVALEQTARFQPVDPDDFVETYPYLPHHIGLSIDIMSALRLQTGGVRHLGGSNRTIIKQAYEMLVNERTRLADAPVGTLVSFDKVYELVAHNLSSEKQHDIAEIDRTFGAGSWEAKVARVLALIEQVHHLPRTPRNIAALLYDQLGAPLHQNEVETALQRLEADHFVRQAEGGWKLLTLAEKTWEAERREVKVPLSQERDLLRDAIARLWEDPGVRTFGYRNLRNFSFHVHFLGQPITRRGDLLLYLTLAESPEELKKRVEESRRETRAPSHRHEIHWVFPLTPALDNALQELARSTAMVNRYDQLDAQGMLENEQRTNLQNEKRNRQRWQAEVDRLLREALFQGMGVFQGQTQTPAALHAHDWKGVLRGLVEWVVPLLYDQLEEGTVPLPTRAAVEVLNAADLSRLPTVFYKGKGTLNLIVESPDGYILNEEAPVAAAILAYIRKEQEYGSSVTGKKLEEHFSQPPYGWSEELVRAVMALLVRTGRVEVLFQGRRLKNPDDPTLRSVFEGPRNFRAATFRLRQEIDLRVLARAGRTLGRILGEDIRPEEIAIYEAARTWAETQAHEVEIARTRALDAGLLALLKPLDAFLSFVRRLRDAESEEVVHILAEEGQDLQAALEAYQRVRPLLEDQKLAAIRRARHIFTEFWPEVQDQASEHMRQRVEQAQQALAGPDLPERWGEVIAAADAVAELYRKTYEDFHVRRGNVYQEALETASTWPEWEQVSPEDRERALRPLLHRACSSLDYDADQGICRRCRARIATMRSDLRAVKGYLDEARQALRETIPVDEQQPIRVRLRDLVPMTLLRTPEDVESLLDALRQHLLTYLEQGEEVEIE